MRDEVLLSVIEGASRCLEELEVAYALVGGAAMPAWGRVRATADADFLVFLEPGSQPHEQRLRVAIDAFRSAGFAHLERADRRQIEDKCILSFWYPVRPHGYSVRLDLIVVSDPTYREVVDRAVVRSVDGLSVRVASCEDLILLKLAAGRPIDLADARELVELNRATLDVDYLESRAQALGLGADLSTLLSDP